MRLRSRARAPWVSVLIAAALPPPRPAAEGVLQAAGLRHEMKAGVQLGMSLWQGSGRAGVMWP